MIYFIVLFLLLILTIRYDINGKIRYRDQWYKVILVILILIAGLRYRLGEDTLNYMYMFYYDFPNLKDLDLDTLLSNGEPPLWILLNSTVKTLGGRFFVVQLIQAAILNTLMLKFFKKHSSYPFACVALFFFWRYQWYSMVVMKAAIALSIILFANDFFLEKKYIKGFLLMLIATGFHPSSLVLFITPFLTFLRFNKIGVLLLVCAYFIGAILQSLLGDIFLLFEASEGMADKLDNYMESDFMTQNYNFNYFIVYIFPLIIYPILSLVYLKRNCRNSQVLRLEPFVMLGLLFQMMQFNIEIMYRYVYVFSPYYIIFIIHFFIEYSNSSLVLNKSLSFIRSFLIVVPLLAHIIFIWKPLTHPGFHPYSSVIERSIDKNREKYYGTRLHYGNRYQKNKNLY